MTPARHDITLDYLFERSFPEPNSGCWFWMGCTRPKGYGVVVVNGKNVAAHRIAATLAHGDGGNLHALHKCDTPGCVNPDHLYWGTNAENVADKMRRGRHQGLRGEEIGTHVLSEETVRAIILAPATATPQALALQHGVSWNTVSRIRVGKSWAHVLPDVPRIRGRGHGFRASLSPETVANIRRDYVPRHPQFGAAAMARQLGVYRSTVENVLKGTTSAYNGNHADDVRAVLAANAPKLLAVADALARMTAQLDLTVRKDASK